MSRLLRTRWFPRYAWALPALLLALLGALLLPALTQGAEVSYQVLHTFALSAPPQPVPVAPSGLLLGADGNLYGTTYYGGSADLGAVFMLTPTGTFTTVSSFPAGGAAGANPAAGLLQDSDGNFYGTTYFGGPADLGTVFTLTPAGTLTPLHAFSGTDGAYPTAGLVRAPDGTLYGTTLEGGSPGYGTLFRLAPSGPAFTLTTLHAFSGSDGAYPQGGLLSDGEGGLYGTTSGDDSATSGTVFKLTPSGGSFTLTTLHPFTGTDGANPQGTLLRDPDGTLYGTTYGGGSGTANLGTVFKLTPSGGSFTLTTLHAFTGTDGAHPAAGLLRGADGNLYGTTVGSCVYGGDPACTEGYGTVFRLAPDGSGFTTLHIFDGATGANPQTGLTQDAAGSFYGTTSQGGSTGGGVLFVLRVGHPLTVSLAGAGSGTVTSTPAGLSCPGTCSAVFPPTTTVTLTATPAAESLFTGWGGSGLTCPGTAPCTVPMTAAQSVTATFAPAHLPLSVSKAGTGAGTVTSSPAGIACGATCSAEFAYGTPVTLTATPAAGCTLTWGGACTGTGSTVPCTLTLDQAWSVTATFDDKTSPKITHTPVTSWAVTTPQTAIPITATITDNVAVQGATLYYRTTGATTYIALTLTAPGPTFNWTIPAGAVTKAGVQYYLEARDTAGNSVRLPSAVSIPPYYSVVVGTSVFTDDPLVVGKTAVRAVHFIELRAAINAVRTKAPYNLPAFTWSTPAPATGGTVRAVHLTELRTALTATELNAAYKAKYGKDIGFKEAITAGGVIKASHLSELRMYVRALE